MTDKEVFSFADKIARLTAERDAAVAVSRRVRALVDGLTVPPGGIGPVDDDLLLDLTEGQALDTGEPTNDLTHTAGVVRGWLLTVLNAEVGP